MSALVAIAELELRRMLGGRRALVIGGLLLCVALLAAAVRFWAPPPPARVGGWTLAFLGLEVLLYLQTVVILVPLLQATSLIKDDEEEGTLVYLLTRPVPRGQMLLAKFAAMLLVTAGALVAGQLTFQAAFAWAGPDPYPAFAHGWRFMLAGALAALAYGSLFTLLGLVTRRGMILGIVYGFLSEFVLQFFPVVLRQLTVMHHLRSIALSGEVLPEELKRLPGLTDFSDPWSSGLVLVVSSAGLLGLGTLAISVQELGGPREETG